MLERGGELVHLRLVGEAGLHGAEAAHRAAGRVVRVGAVAVDRRRSASYGPTPKRRRVADHRFDRRGVRAAVEQDLGEDVYERSVARRTVRVAHARGVAVHVPEERLLAVVGHLHGTARCAARASRVDLHREVLPAAERAADPGEGHPDLVFGQVEAGRDLFEIRVQPLRRHVQFDAAVRARIREPGLGAEERLVLHADLVFAGDLHVGQGAHGRIVRGAAAHRLMAHEVAAGIDVRAGRVEQRAAQVGDRFEDFVLDDDRLDRAARGLRVVGGDDRDRLAVVAHLVDGQDGMVVRDQAVVLAAGNVLVRQHRVHAGQRERGCDVDPLDQRPGMRAAQGRAEQHPRRRSGRTRRRRCRALSRCRRVAAGCRRRRRTGLSDLPLGGRVIVSCLPSCAG